MIVINSDGTTKGSIVMLDQYVNQRWTNAAKTGMDIVATEFVLDHSMSYSHFSFLSLNIQKFIVSGPTAPIEGNLLTSGIINIGICSMAEGKVRQTPFLNIKYNAAGYEPIRPTGQSIGPWPPKGYEFIIPDAFKKKL